VVKKLRIYVDTSVIGGCLDEEFRTASRALLEMVRKGEVLLLVSDVLTDELAEAPAAVQDIFGGLPAGTCWRRAGRTRHARCATPTCATRW